MRKILKKNIGLFYILPWLLGFLLLQLYPFIISFYYSFTNYDMFSKPKWIGFRNYIQLFTIDPEFVDSLKTTLSYVLMTVPGKLIFALFIAVVLNMKIKGVGFFRVAYYLPSIIGGSVAVSALWKIMFMRDGIVNRLLALIGIAAVDWIGSPKTALFTISLIEIWQFGSSMVLFLAALKQVPAELYEAAKVDGAGPVRVFFKVTLPMISSIIFFNVIMQTINALQHFTSASVITGGGPLKATYVSALKIYEDAFKHFKMGYASAESWVIFAFILVFTLLLFRSSEIWVHYSDEEITR